MVKIGTREVGYNEPTYVIGEAGLNHNGNLEIAKQLVDIAKKAGCDAVKFQTFKESELNFKNLTYPEFEQIKKYCDAKNITFLSTPHSLSAVDFLAPLVPAFKIASPHITNKYFVKRVKMKGKTIIASTGSVTHRSKVATDDEIRMFLSAVHTNLILLYCVSEYPCYNFDIDNFKEFMDKYSIFPVGISCHNPGIEFVLEAVRAGACLVEKHITLDDDFDCPDRPVSLNPNQLTELVKCIREIENDSSQR